MKIEYLIILERKNIREIRKKCFQSCLKVRNIKVKVYHI